MGVTKGFGTFLCPRGVGDLLFFVASVLPVGWGISKVLTFVDERGLRRVSRILCAFSSTKAVSRRINQILEGAEDLAKKTCLSLDETKMWLKHLDDVRSRRRQGAQKAAATRAAKKGNRFKLKFLDVKQERY